MDCTASCKSHLGLAKSKGLSSFDHAFAVDNTLFPEEASALFLLQSTIPLLP